MDMRGKLDALAGEALDQAYEQAHQDCLEAILLNLHEVQYINSTGIALLSGLIGTLTQDQWEIESVFKTADCSTPYTAISDTGVQQFCLARAKGELSDRKIFQALVERRP
jgi:hypothetical protein